MPLQGTFALLALAVIGSAVAQPFAPGQGVGPLGTFRTTDAGIAPHYLASYIPLLGRLSLDPRYSEVQKVINLKLNSNECYNYFRSAATTRSKYTCG